MDNFQIDVERLKNLMTSAATDLNIQEENEIEYTQLRQNLLKQEKFKKIAPEFVRTCGSLKEFRREMQALSTHYVDRRKHIKDSFYLLIASLYGTEIKNETVNIEIQNKNPTPKNKIELSTRRNILDAFTVTQISWYGSMEQNHFLGRLFDLTNLPSNDSRYDTADEDIYKHTVLNNDWADDWVFTDRRFNLLHTDDDVFLDFLCLTLHPTVRTDNANALILLEIYNNNISKYGIIIAENGDIAGKPTYKQQEIKHSNQAALLLPENEKKLALVIGCSKYIHAGELINPSNDADSMADILESLGFNITKISNPTQKELKIAIDDFGEKLIQYKTGLFYFAGHGIQVKGLNYLIPTDANLKNERMAEYDCVEVNRVLGFMEDSKANVNIVILDACRNNPFERNWSRGIGLRGLAQMDAPKGSFIAYSTSPGKTASDGDGKNGLYTEALLKYIGTKQRPITTMFQDVRRDVIAKSNNEQVPWEATSLTSDFFFNP